MISSYKQFTRYVQDISILLALQTHLALSDQDLHFVNKRCWSKFLCLFSSVFWLLAFVLCVFRSLRPNYCIHNSHFSSLTHNVLSRIRLISFSIFFTLIHFQKSAVFDVDDGQMMVVSYIRLSRLFLSHKCQLIRLKMIIYYCCFVRFSILKTSRCSAHMKQNLRHAVHRSYWFSIRFFNFALA